MKHYHGLIIIFSATTLLFILAQVWHAQSAMQEKRQEQERQLKGLARILNVQAEKISDESTHIDSVTYADEVMRISYTLKKVTKDEVYNDAFCNVSPPTLKIFK